MPWLSWFEENRNARSSKPSSRSGQRSTLVYRRSPGSAWTAALTRFLPTPVRPAAPSARFTRSRSTGGSLVQRAQVSPRLPKAVAACDEQQPGERGCTDGGGDRIGQDGRGRRERDEGERAGHRGAGDEPAAAPRQYTSRE